MEILIARPADFCGGVKRAIMLVEKKLGRNKNIYCLGSLIHNEFVVKSLEKKGLKTIQKLGRDKKAILAISAHGAKQSVVKEAQKRYLSVLDATCPNVKLSQQVCSFLRKEKYFVVIIGDKKHPEIQALSEYAGPDSIIIDGKERIKNCFFDNKKIGVVIQTTRSKHDLDEIVFGLSKHNFKELRVFNTICGDIQYRQRAASVVAQKSDSVIVIGGKNSANTKRLYQICKSFCKFTRAIESDNEFDKKWVTGKKKVGIVTGASTPAVHIKNLIEKIKSIEKGGIKTKYV